MAPLTNEGKIADALYWKLSQIVLSPALPISYPGDDFIPPADGRYIAGVVLPNTTISDGIAANGTTQYVGIFRIVVDWKPADEGTIAATEIAGQVIDHFKKGTIIARNGISVRVTRQPSYTAPILYPDKVQVPVTILYQCLIQRA